jgi:preprotein translocase subunit YajC
MMSIEHLNVLVAAAETTRQAGQGDFVRMIGTFAIFGVIFYFVLIRPQQKRAREQAAMLKTVKAGDKVMTSGGVIGVVITVKDKSLTLRSADSKMEITKSALAEIVERAGESDES